jgi:hypothetical protein
MTFITQKRKNCIVSYVVGTDDTRKLRCKSPRVDLEKILWAEQTLVTNVINLFLNESEQKLAERGIGILLFWSWIERRRFKEKKKDKNRKKI